MIMHRAIPARRRSAPWQMSPNMTPKRKGKVTHVKSAGFISLYLGTSKRSTIT